MRFAVRSFRRKPILTFAAVVTVALAIGANTALFAVVYTVLFRPLPFHDPDKLVQVWETHPSLPQLQVTVPDFNHWQNQATSFDQVAAYTLSAMNTMTLLDRGEPDTVHATMASSNLFPTMGIHPLTGRAFTEDEAGTKQKIAVLSENLWRRKFGADPMAIGTQMRLGADSFKIVGVVPQEQAFPEWADLWIPLTLVGTELQDSRKYHPLEVIARLKAGVSPEQAQSEIKTIADQLAHAFPDTNATVGAYLIPFGQAIRQGMQSSLLLAWSAVALVLLIACVNLAQFFMVGTIEKRKEMDIREALGADRWHLVWQVIAESLLMAGMGGAAGIVLGAWAIQFATAQGLEQLPRIEWTAVQGPVLLFMLGISVMSGILFGLPACWQILHRREQLSRTFGRSVTHARSRLGTILIASEVAMALLVITGGAILTRSFATLLNQDPGFQTAHVLTVFNLTLRNGWDQSAVFLNTQLLPVLREVPGVEAVAAVNAAPTSLGPTEQSRFATRFGIEGRTFDSGYPVAQSRWVTPEYFGVLGIPLKQGRRLTENDWDKPRILINESLADRFFPGQDVIGKRLILGVMDTRQTYNEIVGVVKDVLDMGLDRAVEPTIYLVSTGPSMTLLIKTAADPDQFSAAIRDAIHRVDPTIPVTKIQSLEGLVSNSLARRRFALTLLRIFGFIAAFLATVGIYGLLAYDVHARLQEFGIRAAVGATSTDLMTMILRQAATLVVPGIVVGVALSLSLSFVMKSFVYQISPLDPISIISASFILTILTLLAAGLSARRAVAVDTAAAMRVE